ncbi:MAG: autotransporter outer membrane beta-barrel domain-containing protein [Desulfobulbus sp.]|nr:autotransporter outer membrane beta-barrel domain-containing protein [Desulfobulbus sp.]
MANAGLVSFGTGTAPGTVLTVNGDVIGQNGTLAFNTYLGDDGSPSDRLVIDGGAGSGITGVTVTNVGGPGTQTVANGIRLVQVENGATTTPSSFMLNGRVVAGTYEYDLYRGGVGADAGDGDWYLRSLMAPESSSPPTSPPTSTPTPSQRPEPYLYLRNLAAASSMFVHTLHDRLGEPQYTDTYRAMDQKNGGDKVPAAWARVVGSHANSESNRGKIDLDTDTSLVHFGGDIARWNNSADHRYHLGVMGAYGKADTDAYAQDILYTNNGLRRKASGDVKGYGLGLYGTWYGNGKKPQGPYIDTWAMYGWYDNTIKGNGLPEETYNSDGWTASVETGYAFVVHDGVKRQWLLEPQAQLAYISYSEDNHREANGTWVTNSDADGWITRLGARLYNRSKQDDNGIQPFLEGNWWHSSANNSLDFNGQTLSDGVPSDRYELKAGLQGEIKRNWQLWGHFGTQFGKDNYDRYEAMAGVKYVF